MTNIIDNVKEKAKDFKDSVIDKSKDLEDDFRKKINQKKEKIQDIILYLQLNNIIQNHLLYQKTVLKILLWDQKRHQKVLE